MCSGGPASLGFTPRDLSNYVQALRRTPIEDGEETFLQEWFISESCRNPTFYHDIQYDSENRIESIFWADARMQLDYHCFGDTISFDTTYRTNNEFRSLVYFFGLNHYRNLIVLGTYLLYEETTEGFKWLFTTFLECMKGKKPKTIFTDQCPAIAGGIRIVMSETFHGLCTFHINENAKDKFRKASQNGIVKDLSHLMFGVDNEAEFDQHWDMMLQKHFTDKLPEGHSWLTYIRKFRHQ
ncbi:Protein FAR-RED IMPAIRED RESPONSE 1 [Linum grandiflorum]